MLKFSANEVKTFYLTHANNSKLNQALSVLNFLLVHNCIEKSWNLLSSSFLQSLSEGGTAVCSSYGWWPDGYDRPKERMDRKMNTILHLKMIVEIKVRLHSHHVNDTDDLNNCWNHFLEEKEMVLQMICFAMNNIVDVVDIVRYGYERVCPSVCPSDLYIGPCVSQVCQNHWNCQFWENSWLPWIRQAAPTSHTLWSCIRSCF